MSHSKPTLPKKSPFQLYILNGISLAGIALAVALTQHFYDIRNGTAGFKSFCNVSQSMNCDVVTASPHAELFFGLPLASFVSGWFLALFIVSLIAYNRYWRREAVRAMFGLSLTGTLIGFFYLFLMYSKLKTYCLLCLGVDALNILGLFLILSLKPEGFSLHRPDWEKWKIILPSIVGSVLFSVLMLKTLDNASFSSTEVSAAVKMIVESPPISVQSGDEFPSIGPKSAKITIVEFSDFQCPFCRIGAFAVNSVVNRYPDQIRIVFRNYPLDQSCNRDIQQSAHPIACEAARVALCAHKQGKFEQAYQELFERQASFTPGVPYEIAKQIGLDSIQTKGCADSPEIASLISKDIEEAIVLGIKSTPTFFANGHKIEGAMPAVVWIKIIDQLLGQTPKP